MPVVEQPSHIAGEYPDTVRHVSNGDSANQTVLRNPSQDLEYRTDVLKDFVNGLETSINASNAVFSAFDTNHDHSGGNGEQVIDFQRLYDNSSQTLAIVALATDGKLAIRKSGGVLTLLQLDDAATTDKTKIIFPGSDAIFDHVAAPASDLTNNPHDLQLAGRVAVLSSGCLIEGLTEGPFTEIVLDPTLAEGQPLAAPGLFGKTASDGATATGIQVGTLASPGTLKSNIVLIYDDATGEQILEGPDPVYGLLTNLGTVNAPIWQLSFFAAGVAYEFATDKTVRLYGQEIYSLSSVPVVDPAFIILARDGVAL